MKASKSNVNAGNNTMTRYHVKLLLTFNDGSDQTCIYHVDAWSAGEAVETAKGMAWQWEEVVDVEVQMVS